MIHHPDDPIPGGVGYGEALANHPYGCQQAQAIHGGGDAEVQKSSVAGPWPQRKQ
ncbi:MAG TPA: hypothetical protein VI488_04825 [Candidatus Angelobacter sp.]